jgi:nucleotide-binding universal stress UspA family protein
MFQKILVGYIDEEHGHEALALGRVLAAATGAALEVATANEDGDGLAELAQAKDCDLIVLGPTRRGPITRVVPGATVERLLGAAPCSIAVAPPGFGEDGGIRVIGVAFDDSPAAAEALKSAVQLALANNAALRVYAVADQLAPPPLTGGKGQQNQGLTSASQALRDALHETVAELPSEARALPVFLRGDPARELTKAAEVGIDLLVMGSRGGGPVQRMLHHSVTSSLIQDGTCPVLISPAGVAAPPADPG